MTSGRASGEPPAESQGAGSVEQQLWRRLRPEHWPVPPEAFPEGAALVGGAVRDALLGRLRPHPDLDLVVPSGAIALARRLAGRLGGSCVVLDQERDMARLVLGEWTVDLARQEGADLATDLRRRDYSANAIALPLAAGSDLVDPTGGLAALAQGRLEAVSEANLLADPLRLLRGVRLAWELDLQLDASSAAWIGRHAGRLTAVAGERVLAELERLAAAPLGHRGLAQALELGLLQPWGADPAAAMRLHQLDSAAAHARGLDPGEAAAALPQARLAALLPGDAVGRLRGSRRLQQRCERLRQWWAVLAVDAGDHAALDNLEEGARLQLQRQLEQDLPALLLLLPATGAATALGRWRDGDDPLFHPRPPLDGNVLRQELALAAGPELGALLEHLSRERAFGRIAPAGAGARSAALAAARQWLRGRRG